MPSWRSVLPGVVLAMGVGFGCHAVLGSLDECSADGDCASRGLGLVCRDHLCVDEGRCKTLGSSDADAVTIGLILPLTVDGRTAGDNAPHWENAVSLVVDQLNPPVRQGIGGRPLRVISCDSTQSPTVAKEQARALVAAGAVAIVSDGSSETLNVASVTVPARVLLVSGSAQSPEVDGLAASPDGTRLVWRTIASDGFVATKAAAYLSGAPDGGAGDDAGAPRVAAVLRDDSFGQGYYTAFSRAYAGESKSFTITPDAPDVSAALASAAAYKPQVLLVVGFPNDLEHVIDGVAAPANAGLTPAHGVSLFFNNQLRSPGLIGKLDAPSILEGARGAEAVFADPRSPAFDWLSAQYQQKYQLDPAKFVGISAYFDAMMLVSIAAGATLVKGDPLDGTHLAQVLTRMSDKNARALPLDPPDFNDAVSALAKGDSVDVFGASGPLDFDPATGQGPSRVDVYRVTSGGAFETVVVIDP